MQQLLVPSIKDRMVMDVRVAMALVFAVSLAAGVTCLLGILFFSPHTGSVAAVVLAMSTTVLACLTTLVESLRRWVIQLDLLDSLDAIVVRARHVLTRFVIKRLTRLFLPVNEIVTGLLRVGAQILCLRLAFFAKEFTWNVARSTFVGEAKVAGNLTRDLLPSP